MTHLHRQRLTVTLFDEPDEPEPDPDPPDEPPWKQKYVQIHCFEEKKNHRNFDKNTWISIIITISIIQKSYKSLAFFIINYPTSHQRWIVLRLRLLLLVLVQQEWQPIKTSFQVIFLILIDSIVIYKFQQKSNTHDESEQNADEDQWEFHFE